MNHEIRFLARRVRHVGTIRATAPSEAGRAALLAP